MHKHKRPVSRIVPMRLSVCTRSPASRAADGSVSASAAAFHKGVQILPGDTLFTRTPCTASSIASAFVKLVTAPLVAAYVVALDCPNAPTHELMLMMLPFVLRRCGNANLHSAKTEMK